MTYLEIVNRLARKVGYGHRITTLSPPEDNPLSGIELDFAEWVNDAWRDIQNKVGWRWMRKSFTLTIQRTPDPEPVDPDDPDAIPPAPVDPNDGFFWAPSNSIGPR